MDRTRETSRHGVAARNRRPGTPAAALAALAVVAVLGACERSTPDQPAAPGESAGKAPAPKVAEPDTGFAERAREAGIKFKMEFLPLEQGENFKINLYDHGCGLAVSDVNGDGHDDVYFVNQGGPNALYLGDGKANFKDFTEEAGVGLGDRICVAPLLADVDGDGDQDLYLTSSRGGNLFFLNDGKGHFTDATEAAGLKLVAHSQSATFFDADKDGDLDLFVANTAGWTKQNRDPADHYYRGVESLVDLVLSPIEHNNFYLNDGHGHFTDDTEHAGLLGVGWGGDAIAWDFDGDGNQDLYIGNMFGANQLMRNKGDGTFEDVTWKTLGRTSWGAIGAKPFDFDGDGKLDMFVADMHSDMWTPFALDLSRVDRTKKYGGPEGASVEIGAMTAAQRDEQRDLMKVKTDRVVFGSTLFRNLGGGKFEEISDKVHAETWWPWSLSAADFDMDGWTDIFIASGMGYPYPYWRSPLLMNQKGKDFKDCSKEFGLDPPPGGPYLDVIIKNRPGTKSSRCTAVGDFDEDGRPDFVMNNFNDRAYLYMNRFPRKDWVAFELHGTRSNHDAICAVVTIRAGGHIQVRQVESAGGYLAQPSRRLLFGLGEAKSLESCEILWPSGIRQTVPVGEIKLNAVNQVTEPAK